MSNDLHIYLKRRPSNREVETFISYLGFSYLKAHGSDDDNSPDSTHWLWNVAPLSTSGFELIYFDDLHKDNNYYGAYQAFLVLQGNLDSSDFDLKMIDITASLFLKRYDGILHNPQRIDRKFPDVYLGGLNRPKTKG